MTADEQPHVTGDRIPPGREARHREAHSAIPEGSAMRVQQDELTAVQNVIARLRSAYPSVDPATVDALVKTAYDQLHQARIRTYVPILVERRARTMLTAGSRENRPPSTPPQDTRPR
ncbi:hypothetical protein OHS81_03820 [Streptomyces sp. NBC_00400]|uniref:three-helix bundle dimerization domain-containing protein n=1 Tax=Streptomyces sp. NBC_00400 TaxID=2975737 RepID=UPI002E20093C